MSAKVFIHGFQQTLPDHEKAKGEYVDGRGIRTFLYRKGAGYVLHTIDPNDPAVEQTATFIGSRDAALWLLAHGIEAPVELWPDLRGRVPFDADGKPIIPAVPNYPSDAASDAEAVVIICPGGFKYAGVVHQLTGRALKMLDTLLKISHHCCTRNELRKALAIDDDAVTYPDQVVKDTAKKLRAALRKARIPADNPLPSTGRGDDLTYSLNIA